MVGRGYFGTGGWVGYFSVGLRGWDYFGVGGVGMVTLVWDWVSGVTLVWEWVRGIVNVSMGSLWSEGRVVTLVWEGGVDYFGVKGLLWCERVGTSGSLWCVEGLVGLP